MLTFWMLPPGAGHRTINMYVDMFTWYAKAGSEPGFEC